MSENAYEIKLNKDSPEWRELQNVLQTRDRHAVADVAVYPDLGLAVKEGRKYMRLWFDDPFNFVVRYYPDGTFGRVSVQSPWFPVCVYTPLNAKRFVRMLEAATAGGDELDDEFDVRFIDRIDEGNDPDGFADAIECANARCTDSIRVSGLEMFPGFKDLDGRGAAYRISDQEIVFVADAGRLVQLKAGDGGRVYLEPCFVDWHIYDWREVTGLTRRFNRFNQE